MTYKRPEKPTRKLYDFDFSKEGSHVAIVDAAANGHTVLITKAADEVLVSLSMEMFLTRFFGMWERDAAVLSMLMGYESAVYQRALKDAEEWDDTWDKDKIEEQLSQIALIKSVASGDVKITNLNEDSLEEILIAQATFEKNLKNAKVEMPLEYFMEYYFSLDESKQEEEYFKFENRAEGMVPVTHEPFLEERINHFDFMKSLHESKDFDNLTEEQKLTLKMFQLQVEKSLLTGDESGSKQDKQKTPVNGEIPNSNKTEVSKGEKMSDKELDALVEVQKSLEEQGKILKALQAENEALKAEKEAAQERELVEKAKGFDFVGEEKAEAVGKLFKSLDIENLAVLLEVFKAAQDQLKGKAEEEAEGDMFVQKSASGEAKDKEAHAERMARVNKALGINKE